MERLDIRFNHLDIPFEAGILVNVPLSQYVIQSLAPEYPGRYNREIPFDIVSNGLDYRTETDWDFMHALITALRANLKSQGSPFV